MTTSYRVALPLLTLALVLAACTSAPTKEDLLCETWYQRCFVEGIEPGYCIPSWYTENCGQDVTTYLRTECEARGGTPIGCESISGVYCSMPTSDAGKPCQDSDECEAECVAPTICTCPSYPNSGACPEYNPALHHGTCAERTGLVCSGVRTVEDGQCGAMTVA